MLPMSNDNRSFAVPPGKSTEKASFGKINGVEVSIKIKNGDKISAEEKNQIIKKAISGLQQLNLYDAKSVVLSLESNGRLKSLKVISKNDTELSKKDLEKEISSHEKHREELMNKIGEVAELADPTESQQESYFKFMSSAGAEEEDIIQLKEKKSLIERLESEFNNLVGFPSKVSSEATYSPVNTSLVHEDSTAYSGKTAPSFRLEAVKFLEDRITNEDKVQIKIQDSDHLSDSEKNEIIRNAMGRIRQLQLGNTKSVVIILDSKGSLKSLVITSQDNTEYSKSSIEKLLKEKEDKFVEIASQLKGIDKAENAFDELMRDLENRSIDMGDLKRIQDHITDLEAQFQSTPRSPIRSETPSIQSSVNVPNFNLSAVSQYAQSYSEAPSNSSSGSGSVDDRFKLSAIKSAVTNSAAPQPVTPRYNVNFPAPIRLTQSGYRDAKFIQSGSRDKAHLTSAEGQVVAPPTVANAENEARIRFLKNVLAEITSTETSFNAALDEGIRRLRFMINPKDPNNLSEAQMSSELGRVLKNYEMASEISKQLLVKFQTAQAFNIEQGLEEFARIFKSKLFAEYSKYINACSSNYNFLRRTIDDAKPEMLKDLKTLRVKAANPLLQNLDEQAIFIQPTQRLPRIRLFFEDLKKKSPENLTTVVEQTLENIKKEATIVNVTQKRQDANDFLLQLNGRLNKKSYKPEKYAAEYLEMAKLKTEPIQVKTFFDQINLKIGNKPEQKIKVYREFFKLIHTQENDPKEKDNFKILLLQLKESKFIPQMLAELNTLPAKYDKDKKEISEEFFQLNNKIQSTKR